MKGQSFEILGVVVLMLAILGLIIFSVMSSSREQNIGLMALSERQETEGFKAGVNSILHTTEDKTGKTMLELLGIAAYNGDYVIDFGIGGGKVDLKRELEKRFDSIYGKGHWYLKLPFPNLTSDIQIVVVADTSGSMCDDIKSILTDVPKIIDNLREKGKKAEMTMFLLGTPACCIEENGRLVYFRMNKYLKTTKYFHVVSIHAKKHCPVCGGASFQAGVTDEDWGTGLKCAIEMGPYKGAGEFGWKANALKIAIPLSDELPCSTTPGCNEADRRKYMELGLKSALDHNVTVFPLRAYACGKIHEYRDGSCHTQNLEGTIYCSCNNGALKRLMDEIANKTGGKAYTLSDVTDAASAIEDIISKANPRRIPYLEAGTLIPRYKDVKAVTIPIPVTSVGEYIDLKVYYWS